MEGCERLRAKYHLETDFVPQGDDVDSDVRAAWALEYIAYHVGQMDKKLEDAVTILKRVAPPGRGS